MNREGLQKFCAKNGTRYSIQKPWSRGDSTYATDGHIAVRIQRLPDIDEDSSAPDVESLFGNALAVKDYRWVGIPEISVIKIKCDFCSGDKYVELDGGERELCEECCGSGELERVEPVRFDLGAKCIGLANVYLKLIRDLPNAEIGLTNAAVVESVLHGKVAPVMFRFEGGDGLLMPMRLAV